MTAHEEFWSWSNMPAMLARAAKRIKPAGIVDIGASDGRWAALARETWQDARLLCIEANPVHEPGLKAFCERTGSHYTLELAGAALGMTRVQFNQQDPFQGVDITHSAEGDHVLVTTVDEMVRESGLPGPYLLKFDTHGHEIAVLEGARVTLPNTTAIVMEVYSYPPCHGALRHWEMCRFLEDLGFLPTDICDPLWRPRDGRLHQVDMLFERYNAPGMNSGDYQ